MLRKVNILTSGDSSFIKGEQAEYVRVVEENEVLHAADRISASYERELLGITPLFQRHRSRKPLVFLPKRRLLVSAITCAA